MYLRRLWIGLFLLHIASVTVIIGFYHYTHSSFQYPKRAEIIINQDIDLRITSGTEHHEKANETKEIKTVVNRQEYEYYKLLKGTDTAVSELHHYFTPRHERVNPLNYTFLIEGNGVCTEPNDQLLLIMCLSIAKNVLQRKTIRETWGQVANNKTWPGRKNAHNRVKLMFIFGTTNSKKDADILERENIKYGDIVQADFVDSYKNLTRKVMMGIKWATIYCPGLSYLMKVDDDTFVHVENVVRDLRRMEAPPEGIVIGHVDKYPRVLREDKWGVPFSDFPFDHYPQYTSGQTYVISANILEKLYNTGEYMPYISIEDAFVTGILRTVINAQLVRSIGYPSIFMKTAAPCSFHNYIRIAATNLSPNEMNNIWEGLSRKMTNCYSCLTENC